MEIRKIRLLETIDTGLTGKFHVGEIIEENEPYSGFNQDGSFTICTGMGIYTDVNPNQFEEICQEK